MQYISKKHALNLPCCLDTCGDWHQSALKWQDVCVKESSASVFKNYGIERDKTIPGHTGHYYVANHIRALLDMLDDGDFAEAQGMNKDFICNNIYDELIFAKVFMLRNNSNWQQIKDFMHKEYGRKWRLWIEKNTGR